MSEILEDADFVLWESSAMLAYVAAKAGRADLAPTTPRERAEVERWTYWQGAHFAPAIRKVAFERIVKKLAGLGAPDEAAVQAGIAEFTETAHVLEESLGTKEYVCGPLTIAALQVLTPAQRAVLLLRDVVGLSAAETATALACSLYSVNSTLHCARVALEARVGPRASFPPEEGAVDRELLERYVRTWEHGDLDAIIALLHDDATLSMPPSPTWIAGRASVARFFTNRVTEAVRAHCFRTVLIEANGRTSAGFYRPSDAGELTFFAL